MSSEEPKVNTHGDSQTEESLPKDIKASLPDKTETTPSTSSQNVSQAVATPAPMPQDQLNLMNLLLNNMVKISEMTLKSGAHEKKAGISGEGESQPVSGLVKPMDIPMFTGKEGEDIREFGSSFLDLCKAAKWPESVAKARFINTAIKDHPTLPLWFRMRDRSQQTMKEIIKDMIVHETGQYALFDDKRAMFARRQLPGESIATYEVAKRDLLRRCTLTSVMSEEEQIFHFVDGLSQANQSSLFALLAMTADTDEKSPVDFKGMKIEDVVRKAKIVEVRTPLVGNTSGRLEYHPRSLQVPVKQINEISETVHINGMPVNDQVEEKLAQLTSAVAAIQASLDNRRPYSGPKRLPKYPCRVCQAAGDDNQMHFPDQCPHVVDAMKSAAAIKAAKSMSNTLKTHEVSSSVQKGKAPAGNKPGENSQVNSPGDAPR